MTSGPIGLALLAIEQAHDGTGDWAAVRKQIRFVTDGPIDAGTHASLFYGAPAVLFVLHQASADDHGRYATVRTALTGHVRRIIRDRLADASQRLHDRRPAAFDEYDLFYGLAGLGALLLQCAPGCDELGDLLTHLVLLTQPRVDDHQTVPGWWVAHDPDPTLPTPGGHANLGMAHGAAGLLALLALSIRHGRPVDGCHEAITTLTGWFDRWRQYSPHGPWWPQWVTRAQLRSGRIDNSPPGRRSWCYGTPGIARALQLAAITTGQADRQREAEAALAGCLTGLRPHPATDLGICHGLAGLYQTAYRAAQDALTPTIGSRLTSLADQLTHIRPPDAAGLLIGKSGFDLVHHSVRTGAPPQSRWDTCLLIH
ncbi:lanthionine synthetase C family protein [Hamadaea sp. NPDC051192]|uniref:lanthionine synthetase C family protein n=1 Tax=Hamadaea sp. NPDC051192 TaxID=3154940 RepID=UPI00342292C6